MGNRKKNSVYLYTNTSKVKLNMTRQHRGSRSITLLLLTPIPDGVCC